MRAVLYCRVSTTEQTSDNQIQALTSWAESRGYQVVAIYQESESAWRQGHQRELARLRQDASRGRFDVVLVWALDRLSRLGPLAVLTIINQLGRHGVKVLSYQEPWTEAPGPLGEVMYSLVAWVAKFESERKSERTLAGLARARTQAPGGRLPTRGPDKKKRKRRSPRPPVWEVL